jgi:hypothetical protein
MIIGPIIDILQILGIHPGGIVQTIKSNAATPIIRWCCVPQKNNRTFWNDRDIDVKPKFNICNVRSNLNCRW